MDTRGQTKEQLIKSVSADGKKTLTQPRRTAQEIGSAHHQTGKNENSITTTNHAQNGVLAVCLLPKQGAER